MTSVDDKAETWVPKWIAIAGVTKKPMAILVEDAFRSVHEAFALAERLTRSWLNRGSTKTMRGTRLSVSRGDTIFIPTGISGTLIFPKPADGYDIFVIRQVAGSAVTAQCAGSWRVMGAASYTLGTTVGVYHFRGSFTGWWLVV